MKEGGTRQYPVKRQHQRFATTEPIYASLTHMPGRLCKIRDISLGGMGLQCSELENPRHDRTMERSLVVNIFYPGTDMRILGIPYEVVHSGTIPSSAPSFLGDTTVRMGLKFRELSADQHEALKRLFNQHCESLKS